MSVRSRLADLERRMGERPCPTCGEGGNGEDAEPRFTRVPAGAPRPGPCPTCGRSPKIIYMRPIRIGRPAATS